MQCRNIFYVLLNRNYVQPELKTLLESSAKQMQLENANFKYSYLDANFPLLHKFPLLPHRSHNDGRKIDVNFIYTKPNTPSELSQKRSPNYLGYGVCEDPKSEEYDTPKFCTQKGYFQYSLLKILFDYEYNDLMLFSPEYNKTLIQLLCHQPQLGKIFIEPHLKSRMNLKHDKIRFHGCAAVRHDDHIHIQL
jgi:hypothetical protein